MRSGLRKITKSVRGKKGSVRRSYWVKAKEGAKGIGQKLWQNKGKLALAGAAVAGGLYLRHRKTQSLKSILKDKEDMLKATLDAERHAKKYADDWLKQEYANHEVYQNLRNAGIHFDRGKSPGAFSRAHATHSTRGEPSAPSRPTPGAPFQLGPGADYKPTKPKRSTRKKK